jgi:putative SOS response-associated peptidase YedK
MCGRFRVARKKEILEAAFDADVQNDDHDWVPRYNVAPGQEIAVVRQDAVQPVRRLSQMRWGLIPSWTNDPSVGFKMINARSETASTMPSFREPLRLRRCLIPADGFYEWKREGKAKLPFCFTLADESVFAFAGLWEPWKNPQGRWIESCSILTTTPNELVRDVHDRMPVILSRDAYDIWLDPGFSKVSELQPLLGPYPAEAMRRYRVSQRVNHVINDDAECAAEIDPAQLNESRESGPLLY